MWEGMWSDNTHLGKTAEQRTGARELEMESIGRNTKDLSMNYGKRVRKNHPQGQSFRIIKDV
jgi:hypothetical protein